ncbi:aminotransferase class III-fold pyridoxal phosphate-dependent enzyme [Salibacterium salarium]|uniref:Aminotransferase class III-fold pyridoxal phosphate-dependent enzyme n=1 Tax=Salibacterium salarium TaxID=284579 RepID=A0A428MY61_9BACI|nr:acetylornithine transaminase [Salibacterium salarium]RSL31075.1 aminotransferase class III-fold pyridoxal phosphate-dependent enzyme [Salibacterium salarium]
MSWSSLDQEYLMHTYQRLPIAIEKGEGNYLIDEEGTSYLDLFTGLAVNILGHSHPYLLRKLEEQAHQFLHISNVFLNKPAITLAQRLIDQSVQGKVFFANSGAEAVEASVKLIHQWKKQHDNTKNGIVVLENSFHGRTLGSIQLTRQAGIYQDFPAADYPVYETQAHDLESLEAVFQEKKPAALLMEPVLGSGGIMPLSEMFLEEAEKLCRQYGVLFCVDEIQTGMGRTGPLFAYQHTNVEPDIILFAKGIGGGLPLGGLIAKAGLGNLFQPGDHGTTFGPNPLSAALGNAVLDVLLDQGGLENGRDHANYLWSQLEYLKVRSGGKITEIRGRGMMLGILLKAGEGEVKNMQQQLLRRGFMVNVTQGTIIRLLPPLTLKKQETDSFVQALEEELTIMNEAGEPE